MVKFALECTTTLLCAVLFVFFLSTRYQLRKDRRVLRFVLAGAVVVGKMLVGYLRIPPLNFISFCLNATGWIFPRSARAERSKDAPERSQ